MPQRAPTICAHPGCGTLTYNESHCPQHIKLKGWSGNEQARGDRHARGYGYAWEKLRTKVLKRDNHLCLICKAGGVITTAKQVDHIVPKSQGGNDTMNNLQSLCIECHNTKTGEESTRRE